MLRKNSFHVANDALVDHYQFELLEGVEVNKGSLENTELVRLMTLGLLVLLIYRW